MSQIHINLHYNIVSFHSRYFFRLVSMGVFSDGSYGTPEGIMFSFPITIDGDKKWSIKQGFAISDFARGKLDATGKELCEEREEAMAVCQA